MRTFFTNGVKSFDLGQYPPEAWQYWSGQPDTVDNELYSKVSAVFRAMEINANAIAGMPFAIMKGGQEIDSSAEYKNVIKVLPKPQSLFRLWRMSLFMTNTAYARLATVKQIGGKPVAKELLYVIPTSITPVTNNTTGDLEYFQRTINGGTQRMSLDDLFWIWRLDHTTELLPSKNTEFKALSQAAGVLYWADAWTKNYFERGGVKPTVLSIKGMVVPNDSKREELEKGWSRFVRNISREVTKLLNGDAMDVKQIGDGVGDIKDSPIYQNAISNVAMATGMPLSLLLANSANYATAQAEYAAWYQTSVVPYCNFMQEWMNEKLFTPAGLRFEFRPEQAEPSQQEEVERANAYATYVNAGMLPSIAAQVVGVDLPQGVEYDELDPEKKKETIPVTNAPAEATAQEASAPEVEEPEDEDEGEMSGKAWQELAIWKRKAVKAIKQGAELPLLFKVEHIPASRADGIRLALANAGSIEQVVEAFESKKELPPAKSQTEILALADAINNATKAAMVEPKDDKQMLSIKADNVTVQNDEAVKAMAAMTKAFEEMKAAQSIVVNVPQQPAPVVNVTVPEQPAPQVTVNVPEQPAPVVNVAPADVTVKMPQTKKSARIIFDANGRAIGIEDK